MRRWMLLLLLSACSALKADPDNVDGTPPSGTGGAAPPPMGGAGGSPPSQPAGVRCGGSRVGPRAMVRLTALELENTLRDIFPEATGYSLGLSDSLESKEGFVNPGRLVYGEDSAEKLLTAAKTIAEAVTASLGAKFTCNRDAACAAEVVKRYGRRLFRRALTAEEQQRYVGLYTAVAAKSDFARGAKWTLVALIQSPNTLYRREVGTAQGGAFRLGPLELASELAYTFTGTTPSEELLAKAETGKLATKEALLAEARALLESPAGRAAMAQYFRLWLGYDQVRTNQRDRVVGFSTMREKLVEETRQFVERVIYNDKGGVKQLLTAPYTVVDNQLAQYYGLPSPPPGAFASVQRLPGQGIGILAQASLLADRSQSLNSSPTKRGILVRRKFLCLDVPPQPAVVPDLPPAGAGWRTTRQRFESAHARAACAACHRFFDPIGFPLEHFDEGGRFRQNENGEPIDASGYASADGQNMLFTIKDGEEELANVLAARPDVAQCVSETLIRYLLAQAGDCLSDEGRANLLDGKIGLLEFAARAATAPHFSERR